MVLGSAFALAILAGVGVFMAVWSLRAARPTGAELVELRLDAYEGRQLQTLQEIELQASFIERMLLPAIRRLASLLAQTAPQRQIQDTERRLAAAGRPFDLSAAELTAIRYVATLVLALVALGLGVIFGQPLVLVLAAGGGAAAGLLLPEIWLRRLADRRRQQIREALPDALDLMVVSVEAGLAFEAAMDEVARKFQNAIGEEFARVLQETRIGRPHLDALDDMGRRCGVVELHDFVQATVQAEQLGAPIAKILRLQADDIRRRRLQRAQVQGARAALKMLLPMIGCIFPTLWVILLGPALLIAIDVMGASH